MLIRVKLRCGGQHFACLHGSHTDLPKVKAWLAKHMRYHMHFTPTYSSWLNQVERWFGMITQRAIRHGSFRNVRQLITSIERYVARCNQHN